MNNSRFNFDQYNDTMEKKAHYNIADGLSPAREIDYQKAKRINYPSAVSAKYQRAKSVNYPTAKSVKYQKSNKII